MGKLEGKAIIVTGSGMNIGRVYAEYLAVDGASLGEDNIRVTGVSPGMTSLPWWRSCAATRAR